MVDKPRLDEILRRLNEYVGYLRKLAGTGKGDFLASRETIGSAKYHLVISIESCLDAANHIIASERFRAPGSRGDAFVVLVEEGILPPEKREAFEQMAGFRNLLVHGYAHVDDGKVYRVLQNSLDDFDVFARAVARLP